MANWSVALAQRPLVPRNRKKTRHHGHNHQAELLISPSLNTCSEVMPLEAPFPRYGNIFKHLCQPEDGEHDCHERKCERITVNVSGLHFITSRSVLEAHPKTLLGRWDLFLYHAKFKMFTNPCFKFFWFVANLKLAGSWLGYWKSVVC